MKILKLVTFQLAKFVIINLLLYPLVQEPPVFHRQKRKVTHLYLQ